VTEVGLLLMDDGMVVEEWSALVNPGRHIPPGVEALTGISDRMVERAPRFETLAHDLAQRLVGRVLVAHNARFDYAFLRNEFRRAGLAFDSRVLCTVRLSRRLAPAQARHNLDVLVERHALTCDGRHRALPDARLVRRLLAAWSGEMEPEAMAAAAQEVIARASAPGTVAAVFDDLPDAPGVYLLFAPDGAALYAGKAANLRTHLLAHYAERGARGREQRAALQAGAIEWTATAGALGAGLRHLSLLHKHTPRQNRRVRDSGGAWALHWQPQLETQVRMVELEALDPGTLQDLYGPFRCRTDALTALRAIAREHELCASLVIGTAAGSVCPPDWRCRGACTGAESRPAHMLRVIHALARLRMAAWPFRSAIALVEEDRARTRAELHLLREWRYLGSAASPVELTLLQRDNAPLPPFDVDVYRLLRRALDDHGRFRVIDLAATDETAWAF
jgi:DNA polymerase-3 subunit epsilon